jgi:DNA repair protein RadC
MVTHKIKEMSYYHTRIKEWPEAERPREKLLEQGAKSLSDAELLALLIESGTGGITAVDLAKRLLTEHRNLNILALKEVEELIRMKGIGPARGARILAAFEIGRRTQAGRIDKRAKIGSPADIVQYYLPKFGKLKREVFSVVLLDSGNRIIRDVIITQGTLNASVVHPREVFKAAVDHLAAGVVLLHNHPSGEAYPSEDDKYITSQLVEAGKVMGIPILDHIILADNQYFSFAREGLLKS